MQYALETNFTGSYKKMSVCDKESWKNYLYYQTTKCIVSDVSRPFKRLAYRFG